MHETKKDWVLTFPALVTAILLSGCAATESLSSYAVSQERVVEGERFGFVRIGVGMAGLPGRDDIRPGPVISAAFPPQGILIASIMVLYIAAIGEGQVSGDFSGIGYLGPEYATHGHYLESGPPTKAAAVAWDVIFAHQWADDLTYGGDVKVFTAGTGVRFISGLWEGARWHGLAGVQGSWMNFENRNHAFNPGVYVGFGLEFMVDSDLGITAGVRYAFLGGDEPDYDQWETTIGLSTYW